MSPDADYTQNPTGICPHCDALVFPGSNCTRMLDGGMAHRRCEHAARASQLAVGARRARVALLGCLAAAGFLALLGALAALIRYRW